GLEDSTSVFEKVDEEFGKTTGRHYGTLAAYAVDDAEVVLIAAGSLCGSIRAVVDELRERGGRVGLVSVKLFRPFPGKRLAEMLRGAKAVGVLDRALCPGAGGGPLYTDTLVALHTAGQRQPLVNFIGALGGRDLPPSDIRGMFDELERVAEEGHVDRPVKCVGLRERAGS
ncbi:MAG: pyruvate ferredoxin oxidoreductase, partial [Candidatus Bathyarchaeia archaeon]